ncbi:diacylglycerol/lipid kinase family protein [Altererythrobacter sp.]|uniref:diacylglycerol/lipid kinase family protein n=1 Tax=Altererythrobacter sp. TaxID=1872480 RepID=UPI003CFE108B
MPGPQHQPAPGSAPSLASAPPKVGVIYNPRSHRNKGQDLASDPAPHVFVAQPGHLDQLPDALERFRQREIELLVINGGDGTVRDALTAGAGVFGDNWPAVAVLPKGKTNALTVDLDAPTDWSLQDAIDAYTGGRRILRRPLRITPQGDRDSALLGFILGAGAFTLGIQKGQDAHRLGAFNSLAVGVTTLWGLLSAILGSRANPWRKGAEMDIRLGPERNAAAHSGLGDPRFRQLLLASTLERFPAGIRPFGNAKGEVRLALLDQATRRTLLRLPLVLSGRLMDNMAERGLHQLGIPSFEMKLGDQFILDGEAFPAGDYLVEPGPAIEFVAP